MDVSILLRVVAIAVVLISFRPLLEALRRWGVPIGITLSVWLSSSALGLFVFPGSVHLEWAAFVSALATTALLLVFTVMIVRNPSNISDSLSEGSRLVALVQAALALIVWSIALSVLSVTTSLRVGARSFESVLSQYGALLWESADVVPAVEIANTMGWSEPARTGDEFIGWLRLLARAVFLVSILAVAKALYETHLLATPTSGKSGNRSGCLRGLDSSPPPTAGASPTGGSASHGRPSCDGRDGSPAEPGDYIVAVLSNGASRQGKVVARVGGLLTVRWDDGIQTKYWPSPGAVRVVARTEKAPRLAD